MTLYKTIWTLLKANKSNLLIGVIITVVATFFFAQKILMLKIPLCKMRKSP